MEAFDETDGQGHIIGNTSGLVLKYGANRGALIFTCNTFKELIQHAESLAVQIGMPKSRIWDIFDWNQPT